VSHLLEDCEIGLEYALVARDSLDVLPVADKVLQQVAGAREPVPVAVRGELEWSNRVALHTIRLRNARPTGDLQVLARRLQDEIVAMDASLAGSATRLMPGGMHPWMNPAHETRVWPRGKAAVVYEAYDRIFDCRTHGWSSLQSVRLHLPFANDAEFAQLHAAVRVILPILPALAAASPYADGRATDWMDYRMEAYRHNADKVPDVNGEIVPEPAIGRDDYERRILQPMYRAIAPFDTDNVLQHEWLNGRGAIARFDRNALEIRVLDVQECPAVDVAIAALVIDFAADLCEGRFRRPTLDDQMGTRALARLFLACIHDGDRARIDDPDYLALLGLTQSRCTAGEAWWEIAERLDRTNSRYSSFWRAALEFNLSRGPLARRLLRAIGPRPDRAALHELYSALCDALQNGKPFDP